MGRALQQTSVFSQSGVQFRYSFRTVRYAHSNQRSFGVLKPWFCIRDLACNVRAATEPVSTHQFQHTKRTFNPTFFRCVEISSRHRFQHTKRFCIRDLACNVRAATEFSDPLQGIDCIAAQVAHVGGYMWDVRCSALRTFTPTFYWSVEIIVFRSGPALQRACRDRVLQHTNFNTPKERSNQRSFDVLKLVLATDSNTPKGFSFETCLAAC